MAISREKRTVEGNAGPVRERLLDTAERLFSEHGFEGTSVRDLASAAGCNIASVNYYFGGKEKLYEEVFRRHLIPMTDIRIASIDKVMTQSNGKPELEVLLRAFANAFIEPLADEAKASRFMKLMIREMIDNHLPSDLFVKDVVIPTMGAMQTGVVKACPGLDEARVPLIVHSVIGQLVQAVHSERMLEQAKVADIPKFELAKVIDHIVKFSAAGIRAYAGEKSE
ncbi:MAG: CerR family C-terminal domain-containing protein [Phycisphaerae bacterium]|nr:CerR family C-terminal domain-containing protein [Phycisphaerae bacterium]